MNLLSPFSYSTVDLKTTASRLSLLLLTLFWISGSLFSQTTWNGNTSTDWNNVANWSAGIPDTDDDVTIPNVTNDPVINASGAAAKSVTVQAGGLLTVNASGVLAVNGATTQGFTNQGTVQNSGIIHIGNITTVGVYGLVNQSSFNNNTGGQINIDRAGGVQAITLYNSTGGTFTNQGTVRLGSNAASGQYGLDNSATFNNLVGGQLFIDRVTGLGIRNSTSNFSNSGTITIGASPGGNSMFYGLSTVQTFTNNAGGQVNIDRVTNIGFDAGNFSVSNNAGTITIGAITPVTNLIGGNQTGLLNNNTGGVFKATGNIPSIRLTSAGGTLAPGYSPGKLTFDASENFSNSIMAIEVNGTGAPGVNYDQIEIIGTATLGGTLALTFNYNGVAGDHVTILSAQAISGTFSNVTGLAANWVVNYTPVGVVLSYGPLLYNTWTGNSNTDWNTADNWTDGIPDATDNVSIPNVTNDPVLSTTGAVAKSVIVQTGGVLTISASGILAINGSATIGLWNQGTVQNSGTLHIGNTTSVGSYGIVNSDVFNNNSGGQINIDRVSTAGVYALGNNITNVGTITIGALVSVPNLLADPGTGTFNNNTGGTLKGTGTISAARFATAGGTVAPGYSAGTMTFTGAENFANSTMAIEVNANGSPGVHFDKITISGAATLGGTLALTINYAGNSGDEIIILAATSVTGTFSTVTGLSANWALTYLTDKVVLTYGFNYWTGASSTSWQTAANWSLNEVPLANQIVIIQNVPNAPVISETGAVCKAITVLSGGLLTVNASGVLSVNGATIQGFTNQGTVQNSGIIHIGNISSIGLYGLVNHSSFTNNVGGQINIDRSGGSQAITLYNRSGSTFSNSGTIRIGAIADSGQYGLDNSATFTNMVGGQIFIDRVSSVGIRNNTANFSNSGTITIGALAGGNTMVNGISTVQAFNNNTGGIINIDRVTNYGFDCANFGVSNNAGTVIIGAITPVTNLLGGNQTGLLNNNTGGIFKGTGNIPSNRITSAGGTLAPGYSPGKQTFDANENFSNCIMSMEVNGIGMPGVNYDQIVVNGTATLGGTLAVSINYTPANGHQVTIISATSVSGTFSTVTGLPAFWQISYTATSVVLTFDNRDTWTGSVSTDWNTIGNWTTGVPGATTDITIPDVANDPVISVAGAVAKSVHVQPAATLTINETGSLTTHGMATYNNVTTGLYNQGMVINNGTLIQNPN